MRASEEEPIDSESRFTSSRILRDSFSSSGLRLAMLVPVLFSAVFALTMVWQFHYYAVGEQAGPR
jgi:hypothetical protein